VMAAALVGALTSRYRRREPRLVSAPRLLPASDLGVRLLEDRLARGSAPPSGVTQEVL